MQGTIIQILDSNSSHDGKRAIISSKHGDNIRLQLSDGKEYDTTVRKCFKVYCLGVPREYRVSAHTSMSLQHFFMITLHTIDSSKFYVLPISENGRHAALLINVQFFQMIFDKITTEPLVRFYATCLSHGESNIIFDQKCVHIFETSPWYYDMTQEHFSKLLSRFSDIDETNDAYKRANLTDFITCN
jgi:hypothetical protein